MTEENKLKEEFLGCLEENCEDIELLDTIEGKNYGGKIYQWKSRRTHIVVMHGQKYIGFTDYSDIDFYSSKQYAAQTLQQDIDWVDNYGGVVVWKRKTLKIT